MPEIKPYRIEIDESQLEDLRRRLAACRWPNPETSEAWGQGVPLDYMKEVCAYWAEKYDWRRCESRLNAFPQYITELDGLDIHFLHVPSPHDGALPLVITHGWPGSVVEFTKVIEALVDPPSHGGEVRDAFHVVCPTLPGFGFSGKPTESGWGVERIGRAWGTLMARLGYDRYVAQGGDWGSFVTCSMGLTETEHCAGIHTNMALVNPSPELLEDVTDFEQAALDRLQRYWDWDSGYSKQQSTRPQTIGYALADSPVGQAAWILDKFWSWTDCDGHPENILSRDELLDNVMMFWLPDAAASSARIYWESFNTALSRIDTVPMPTGVSVFPKEIARTSERWARERFPNLVYFNVLEKGGHFAALEQPEAFVNELRACFRSMR